MEIAAGLLLACVYSLYLLGLQQIRGAAPFDVNAPALDNVLISYICGGVVAAAIIVLFQPLLRWRLGAALVGIVAAPTVVVGLALMI